MARTPFDAARKSPESWRDYGICEELQRVAKLEQRIALARANISDSARELRLIRARCIRRMRRRSGRE